jgi:hypothetical protein
MVFIKFTSAKLFSKREAKDACCAEQQSDFFTYPNFSYAFTFYKASMENIILSNFIVFKNDDKPAFEVLAG